MSPTILNLRHYNTPAVEGIVHPSSNTGYQVDRFPYHKYHNRDRHGFGHPAKSSASDRRSRDHNRGCDVSRAEGLDRRLISVTPGMASKSGGFGENIFGASFSIRGVTG